MRTACIVLVLLAGAVSAWAASIQLSFGPNTTGRIDQAEFEGMTIPCVTLRGSGFAYIDIVLKDAVDGFGFWFFGTNTEGETPDFFTFEEVIPGPNMLEPTPQPAPGDLLNDWYGVNYVYPYITEPGDVLLVTLVVRCTGGAGEALVMLDDLNGEAFVTRADQTDYAIDFASPMVLIRQLANDAGGGGGGNPVDDDAGHGDNGDTDTGNADDAADPGSSDADNDGLPDVEDPDDDDDGVPDTEDAEPPNPGAGDSTNGNGGASGGTSTDGRRSAGAPCGAGMITALPIGVVGWCGLAVRRRSHRCSGATRD